MNLADIKKVGVVGGGTMGFGIAINFALNGYPTVISDLSDEILEQSMKRIESAMALFVEEDLITQAQADDTVNRITTTTDLAEVATHSDFITEAIVERLKDKGDLFNKLDKPCPPHTIIVSNTSGLVLSDIGAGVKRQDKIGLTHYFAPPHIVPGVEVAKGPGTSDETYNIIYDLMTTIKKVPIRVLKELPGYLLNRIQGAMRREAHRRKVWRPPKRSSLGSKLPLASVCTMKVRWDTMTCLVCGNGQRMCGRLGEPNKPPNLSTKSLRKSGSVWRKGGHGLLTRNSLMRSSRKGIENTYVV